METRLAARGGDGTRNPEDSFRLRIKISPRRTNISPWVNRSRLGPGRAHRYRRENLITKRRLVTDRGARYRRGISKRFAGSCGQRNFGGRQCAPILIVGNPSSTKGWEKKERRESGRRRLPEGGGGDDRDRIKGDAACHGPRRCDATVQQLGFPVDFPSPSRENWQLQRRLLQPLVYTYN